MAGTGGDGTGTRKDGAGTGIDETGTEADGTGPKEGMTGTGGDGAGTDEDSARTRVDSTGTAGTGMDERGRQKRADLTDGDETGTALVDSATDLTGKDETGTAGTKDSNSFNLTENGTLDIVTTSDTNLQTINRTNLSDLSLDLTGT